MAKKRPNGYWRSWKNTRAELDELIRELGHFPTQAEIFQKKQSSLYVAILTYYDGLNVVRRKMGYKTLENDKKYWKNFDNVHKHLREVEKDLRHFPNYPELKDLGRYDLLNAIQKYHGGLFEVKKKLSKMEKRTIKSNTVKPRYWQDLDNIHQAIKEVSGKSGIFPTAYEIRSVYGEGIICAIYKNHGGLKSLKEKLGYSQSTSNQQSESLLQNYSGGNNGNQD